MDTGEKTILEIIRELQKLTDDERAAYMERLRTISGSGQRKTASAEKAKDGDTDEHQKIHSISNIGTSHGDNGYFY